MAPAAAPPADETARQARLQELLVLDSAPEPLFDTLTRLAAQLCGAPIALISLVDVSRQWFKACVGLPGVSETPRDVAFCAHAILKDGILEVPDARLDERFAANPLVTGEPGIRFYAGAPLVMPGGERLGTLCVIDRVPRQLRPEQRAQLSALADAVAQGFLMRERAVQAAWTAQKRQSDDFRALAESSPLGVFRTDARGACQFTNASWQAIYGLSLEQSLGDGWSATLHPEDRESVFTQWQADATAGRVFDMNFRVRRPDGAVRALRSRAQGLLDEGGLVQGYVGVVEDVTDRLAAEAEVEASRQQLRRLYEETPAILASIGPDGCILTASKRTLKLLGFSRDELVGRKAHDFVPPDRQPDFSEHVEALLRREDRIDECPTQLLRRDGSRVDVLISAVVERAADRRALRTLAVFQDIGTELASQAELREERDLRRQLQRLAEERREMLDVLAHEVRQPLNNASAALQSADALVRSLADARASERLQRAQGVIGQVVSQLDNTLAAATLLAGAGPLEVQDTDVDTLVQVCIADLPAELRSRVQVTRESATRTAAMDMALMRLALRNLLVNALRHARTGSAVTLRLSDSDEPLALVLDVENEGPAIPPELRQQLFERGARGSDSKGQGLGLYIARRALLLHGGRAECVQSDGRHTVMRLLLVQADPGTSGPA